MDMNFVMVSMSNEPRANTAGGDIKPPVDGEKVLGLDLQVCGSRDESQGGFPGARCGSGDDGERMANPAVRFVGLVGELIRQGRVGAQVDRIEGSRWRCARE
jgi:hypothetical protein